MAHGMIGVECMVDDHRTIGIMLLELLQCFDSGLLMVIHSGRSDGSRSGVSEMECEYSVSGAMKEAELSQHGFWKLFE